MNGGTRTQLLFSPTHFVISHKLFFHTVSEIALQPYRRDLQKKESSRADYQYHTFLFELELSW